MLLHRILCPVDFSPGAARALRVAVQMAQDANAELQVVHAWHAPASVVSSSSDLVRAIHDEAERALEAVVHEAKQAGARVTKKLIPGLPRTALTQELADADYDLVVIATHGRSESASVLLGSVAEHVVHHAACSVLVVRPDSDAKTFDHVLCPVDFSDSSHEAMLLGAQLVRSPAAVTLMHAIELPIVRSVEPLDSTFVHELEQRSNELLHTWAAELRTTRQLSVFTMTRLGRPGRETLALLDEDPSIDFVVMGRRGHPGIERLLTGTVAEKVLRHARCPVLVARSPCSSAM